MFETFDPLKEKKLQVMDEKGKIVNQEWMPEIDDDKIIYAYKLMLKARVVDLRALSYQRQGRLYTLPPNIGQEAAAVGSAIALDDNDWMVPSFRELGAWLHKGATIKHHFLLFGGSEEGNIYPEGSRLIPTSVPIASQLPHAVGIAHAINYQKKDEVVIGYFGDGGTSEGDFHESLNWAAVFNCPVIFFCNNNQYAISHPRKEQTKSKTLAQKAIAYQIPGIQIDGNDIFAVYRATKESVDYARKGNGPVLIEAETYRRGAHTTSDDPTKYRTDKEEKEWEKKDPIDRLRKYMMEQGLWDDDKEKEHTKACEEEVDKVFEDYEKHPEPQLDEIFQYMYDEMPDSLKKQMVELKNFKSKKEGK